jgi:hypothetical protein
MESSVISLHYYPTLSLAMAMHVDRITCKGVMVGENPTREYYNLGFLSRSIPATIKISFPQF